MLRNVWNVKQVESGYNTRAIVMYAAAIVLLGKSIWTRSFDEKQEKFRQNLDE
jgi:hypothetical protein